MIKALALTGPTASGKTALSLSLAAELGCEIISCDSMQIYRGMDIGSAKATADERSLAPHHMLDVVEPDCLYSAQSYRTDALAVASKISKRGRLPLFVGGTGLYIDTLIRGDGASVPESDKEWCEELLSGVNGEEGARALWERLREIDPESAEKIHMNNLRRVARAIEIYERTGRRKSELDAESRLAAPDIKIGMITLDVHNRENLYKRVDKRVELMLDMGLEGEVRALLAKGYLRPDSTAAQGIGYKEMVAYILGECTIDEAKEAIKLASRRYAKRQLTWFRHSDAYRLYIDDEQGNMRTMGELCSEALSLAENIIRSFEKEENQ